MEGIISGCSMIHPFRCKPWDKPLPGGEKFKTYGYRLKKYLRGNRVDKQLVHMVARCMAERPQDRPTALELLEILAERNNAWEEAMGGSQEAMNVQRAAWKASWDKLLGPQ